MSVSLYQDEAGEISRESLVRILEIMHRLVIVNSHINDIFTYSGCN